MMSSPVARPLRFVLYMTGSNLRALEKARGAAADASHDIVVQGIVSPVRCPRRLRAPLRCRFRRIQVQRTRVISLQLQWLRPLPSPGPKKKVAFSFFLALDSIRPKNYSRAPDG